ADGLAYVGTANGIVTVVDLGSGLMVDRIWPGSAVRDLAIGGDVLFVALESELRSYRIGGHLQPLGRTPLALSAEGLTGRRRIFVGTRYAEVSNFAGFETFDIGNPASLRLVGPVRPLGQGSFKQIVDTGSGLGLAAVGVAPNSSTHEVYLFDLSDPTDTSKFLTLFKTPGAAYAVTIHNGLAFAADGEAGLEVINYRA